MVLNKIVELKTNEELFSLTGLEFLKSKLISPLLVKPRDELKNASDELYLHMHIKVRRMRKKNKVTSLLVVKLWNRKITNKQYEDEATAVLTRNS